MAKVDPRFLAARKRAGRRRFKGALWRSLPFTAPLVVAALVGLIAWATWDKWQFGPAGPQSADATDPSGIDAAAAAALNAQFVQAFVDLAGDPLIIQLSDQALSGQTMRHVDRPAALDPVRVISDLVLVSDVMVSAEEHFITTLPSSPEDFAFFQAQRSTVAKPRAVVPAPSPPPTGETAAIAAATTGIDDSEAGWGQTLDRRAEALPEFTETAVENTTSVAFVRLEGQRAPLIKDVFVKITTPRSLSDAMLSNGFTEETAAKVTEAATAAFGRSDLTTGEVLAMRGAVDGTGKSFVQLSLYSGDVYIGSLGRASDGSIVAASDPWVEDDLFNFSDVKPDAAAAPARQYRMLDAFYSAGIRNRMPASLVGEAILLLSRSHNLSSFASPGDKMSVLYAAEPAPDDPGGGQILYISLTGQDVSIECFVYSEPGADFGCYGVTGGASGGGGGGGGLANGMVPPVRGVMTSTFGPRNHPILKTVRLHNGVDWAAPVGTPVTAALAGRVDFAGDGGDYGNLVKMSHAGGFETRYAHMDAIAEGLVAGQTVLAGDLLGYLGSSGLSTGPHLHFEMRQGGQAVDPIVGGVATAGSAVEALVDQIVRVESGGNADAKNPLSSATGLGQFIDSTWLRMMKTYRPDLDGSLTREELLALRNDPTISRQMITNLARESEAYLRGRGHGATPGRLYLAHFLGAEGAAQVLSAVPETDLAELLGAAVVKANPFLTGKDSAYVIGWADQKMSGRGQAVALAPEPAGLAEFRASIKAALQTL